MDNKERIELIRQGNAHFNAGEIEKATALFISANYRDGITRIGDYYFYEKRMPLIALRYYKIVNKTDKVTEIYDRMVFALSQWVGADKVKDQPKPEPEPPSITVSPKLKILAQEILERERLRGH